MQEDYNYMGDDSIAVVARGNCLYIEEVNVAVHNDTSGVHEVNREPEVSVFAHVIDNSTL